MQEKPILGEKYFAEKEIRKVLGLPLTKPLVYYPDKTKNETVSVVSFTIIKEYVSMWSLKLNLENGDTVRILSRYFAEMQSPTFIRDMQVGE